MKKMEEIMKDLGFNKDGSDSVKRAFIENLIRSVQQQEQIAEVHSLLTASTSKPLSQETLVKKQNTDASPVEQLSFPLDDIKKLA